MLLNKICYKEKKIKIAFNMYLLQIILHWGLLILRLLHFYISGYKVLEL